MTALINKQKLVKSMLLLGMTNADLAEKSGVSPATVSAVRCGKTCSAKTAHKFAQALGVPVTEILEMEAST